MIMPIWRSELCCSCWCATADRAWPQRLIVSPAFDLRVGFRLGMNAFSIAWGAILPLRWYMAVLLGRRRGLPLASPQSRSRANGTAVLFALLALPSPALGRGQHWPRNRAAGASAPAAAPRSVGEAFYGRMEACCSDARPASCLAPLIYACSIRTYLHQILRKIPIAVVDDD